MIIVLYSQRGGVAKSTTVKALAAGLGRKGSKVLMIDLDGQSGNLTRALGVRLKEGQKTIYDALINASKSEEEVKKTAHEYIVKTQIGDLVPANSSIYEYDHLQIGGKNARLKEWISRSGVDKEYDYIVMDTAAGYVSTTISAIICADTLIIPCMVTKLAFESSLGALKTAKEIAHSYNPKMTIAGILLTSVQKQYARNGVLADLLQVIRMTCDTNNIPLFKTMIRQSLETGKAEIEGADVYTYKKSTGTGRDYEAFVQEFMANIAEGRKE